MKTVELPKNTNVAANSGDFPLHPITSQWMESITKDQQFLQTVTAQFGSPINIHHLESFDHNIEAYRSVFKEFNVKGQIYFARKANKCKSLVKRALENGVGVDTASYRELEQSIILGGNSENLVLTAAIKTEPMVRLAIDNNIVIIIDNEDELLLVDRLAKKKGCIAAIGLRLSGFKFNGKELYSRFGFNLEGKGTLLKKWFTETGRFNNVKLMGLHFHLDGYSVEERAEAIIQSLKFKRFLGKAGLSIGFLDIGGGFLVNYLEDKEQWELFKEALKQSVIGKRTPITFNNDGLGYGKCDISDKVVGNLSTYPYYNSTNKENFLRNILEYRESNSQKSVAEIIRESGLQLRIEPGRSLLDQVGLTVARVEHRKRDSKGNWLVGLEMNMSQLKSSSRDYLVDPFVVYNEIQESSEPQTMFFTGAYCLEGDVILKRALTYPALPEIGDFVAFVNTAGYMMHFYETEAHLFELSTNLYLKSGETVGLNTLYVDRNVS